MRKTAVVKLTSAETWPHARNSKFQAEFEAVRGKEIRVYLPAEENKGGHCDGFAPIWRVHEDDLKALSPRLAKQFERAEKTIPDVGYFVCEHQLQGKPKGGA